MKNLIAPILAALAATGLYAQGTAAADHDGHGAMHGAATTATPVAAAMADGLIKKVDKPGGKLTISHGPLPNGMPAMTMAFRVKEARWLDQLKEGDRIRFATDTINGAMTVVSVERVH